MTPLSCVEGTDRTSKKQTFQKESTLQTQNRQTLAVNADHRHTWGQRPVYKVPQSRASLHASWGKMEVGMTCLLPLSAVPLCYSPLWSQHHCWTKEQSKDPLRPNQGWQKPRACGAGVVEKLHWCKTGKTRVLASLYRNISGRTSRNRCRWLSQGQEPGGWSQGVDEDFLFCTFFWPLNFELHNYITYLLSPN